jgi:hypothetical protein
MNILDFNQTIKEIVSNVRNNDSDEEFASILEVKNSSGSISIAFTKTFPKDVIHNLIVEIFLSNKINEINSVEVRKEAFSEHSLKGTFFFSTLILPLFRKEMGVYAGYSKKTLFNIFKSNVNSFIEFNNQDLLKELFEICLSDLMRTRYLFLNEIGFIWIRQGLVETMLRMGIDKNLIQELM